MSARSSWLGWRGRDADVHGRAKVGEIDGDSDHLAIVAGRRRPRAQLGRQLHPPNAAGRVDEEVGVDEPTVGVGRDATEDAGTLWRRRRRGLLRIDLQLV